jgi:hypothetical protein
MKKAPEKREVELQHKIKRTLVSTEADKMLGSL